MEADRYCERIGPPHLSPAWQPGNLGGTRPVAFRTRLATGVALSVTPFVLLNEMTNFILDLTD